MSQPTIETTMETTTFLQERNECRRVCPMARYARALLLGRLAKLAEGQITFHDDLGSTTVGPADSPDALSARVDVHDPRFYTDVLLGAHLGAAESYVEGRWSTHDLETLIRIFARGGAEVESLKSTLSAVMEPVRRVQRALARNTKHGSRKNIMAHYDVGNEFFELWLDPTMTYSSGVFEDGDDTLEQSQYNKIDRLCRKLDLQASDHLLEIGTGWGALAIHAAKEYGCRVTTTTISPSQREVAMERIREAGVENRVTVLLKDYRDLEGPFDKIVSVEMIEAVGHEFMPRYFEQLSRLLRADGVLALQAITVPDQRYERARRTPDFIQQYIFPGSCIPSVGVMMAAMRKKTDLQLTHLEDLTPHYARTMRLWREAFGARLDEVRAQGYPERFIRMWDFYLAYCQMGFAERVTGVVQMQFKKPGCRTAPVVPASAALVGGAEALGRDFATR